MPKHAFITVTVPADADTGMLRARVAKTLKAAGLASEADAYIEQTNPVKNDPDELAAATRDWVNLEGAASVASSASTDSLAAPLPGAPRWQYAVVNLGMFNSPERMSETLATAGANGWELVTIYDKTSNWWVAMEKGFMLLKRPVPDGVTPDRWCLSINKTIR